MSIWRRTMWGWRKRVEARLDALERYARTQDIAECHVCGKLGLRTRMLAVPVLSGKAQYAGDTVPMEDMAFERVFAHRECLPSDKEKR